MKVYQVEVEDRATEYCGCDSSVKYKPYGLYSSVEAAIEGIQDVDGPVVKELLSGEGWLLGEPSLVWRESEPYDLVGATILVKMEQRLLCIIDVKEVEVKDGK